MKDGDHLKDPRIDGRIILKWIFEKFLWSMGWIDVALDKDSWRAVVKAVMKLRFP
jgi:hypothetical protein